MTTKEIEMTKQSKKTNKTKRIEYCVHGRDAATCSAIHYTPAQSEAYADALIAALRRDPSMKLD